MLGDVQVEHIRVMCCEDKLLVAVQMFEHQTEDTLFNIALDI